MSCYSLRTVPCRAKCENGRVYLDNGPSGLTTECDECGGTGVEPEDEECPDTP